MSLDFTKNFSGNNDAYKISIGETLDKIDNDRRYRVIEIFFKTLIAEEYNYTANDLEIFGSIYFLKLFFFCFAANKFEVFMDNQIIRKFLAKPKMRRSESHWLEKFGNF